MNENIKKKNQAILEKYFPNHIWPDVAYKNKIKDFASSGIHIGHLGCGKDFKRVYEVTSGAVVIGIDLDLESLREYKTGQKIKADLENLPIKDNFFDLLISEFVFEHIENPEKVIRECSRILKKNGKIIFLTVNKFSIFGVLSLLTPHWFHRLIRGRMLDPKFREDVFRTYYRLNSARKIKKLFEMYGFKEIEMSFLESEWSYFDRYPALYELGCIVNKFIMNTKALHRFQTYLLGVYEKV